MPPPSLLLAVYMAMAGGVAAQLSGRSYYRGQRVALTCQGKAGDWNTLVMCDESDEPLSFRFATDSYVYCGRTLTEADVATYRARAKGDLSLRCRVPADAAHASYVPVTIPLWHTGDPDGSFAVNLLTIFVFHISHGRIVAASSYPLRDRFHNVEEGALLALHGPVRWFKQASFTPVASVVDPMPVLQESDGVPVVAVVALAMTTSAATATAFAAVYFYYLRPRLTNKYMRVARTHAANP